MNVKRFTARTSRDALAQVRQALGEDAVVLSTQPCAAGVEVLAMSAGSIQNIQRYAAPVAASAAAAAPAADRPGRAPVAPAALESSVASDVEQLAMSTLSFQDYVRERMLKRRAAALKVDAPADAPAVAVAVAAAAAPPARRQVQAAPAEPALRAPARMLEAAELRDEIRVPRELPAPMASAADAAQARREQQDMMNELRSMKGLIEDRFDALAFLDKMQRQPTHARLAQKLLDCGFSPALIRKLTDGMGNEVVDESAWVASVLVRNLLTAEAEPALEDQGGVYALIGSTGVGKTTSTAKLAAAFASKHGASNLGLITLDAYRVGAHEQLRTYGRILGVPVHTAHDRASLEDLLDLLSAKKMVLIDTAGMAQRDSRTRELLDMLSHRAIQKLLVVNAAAQGETTEDVLLSYRASQAKGVVLSKLDEAVKLGPALDALIRHKLPVTVVANGQRVPEDWHRLSAQALIHRALRPMVGSAYRMDASDVNLIFAAPSQHSARAVAHAVAHA
jgi:flagellar biosynthesis protein FlhF